MAANEDFLGIERRPAKGARRNKQRLVRGVRAVDFVHGILSRGGAHGVEGAAVKPAAFPRELRFARHAAVEADDMDGLASGGMRDGVHHVMAAEGVGDLHAEMAAHELTEIGLVVQRVATLAIGIKPLHLALRAFARCPHEEQRLAFTVGVLDGGQPADATDIGVRIFGQIENLLPLRAFAINAAEDGGSFGKVQRVIGLGDAQWAREETALGEEREFHVPIPADT